jgi:hypothetical protein
MVDPAIEDSFRHSRFTRGTYTKYSFNCPADSGVAAWQAMLGENTGHGGHHVPSLACAPGFLSSAGKCYNHSDYTSQKRAP